MKILSKIPIRPFRLAYDNIKEGNIYKKAFNNAYLQGIKYFSNYMLYNYKDSPCDLWERLHNAVLHFEKKPDIQAFSFPMKYAPIDSVDRDYIGANWNKKYLSAMNIILNVTKGVVAREKDFFYEAYGSNKKEFIEILTMPKEFIKFRMFFKASGHVFQWKSKYNKLSSDEKSILLKYLNGLINKEDIFDKKIISIIGLYSIKKNLQ